MFFLLLNRLESVISITKESFSDIRVNLNIPIFMGISISIGIGMVIRWINKIMANSEEKAVTYAKEYKVFHIPMKNPREVDKDRINEVNEEKEIDTIISHELVKALVTKEKNLRKKKYLQYLKPLKPNKQEEEKQEEEKIEKILDDKDMTDEYSLFLGCLKTRCSEGLPETEILIAVRVFKNINDIQLNIFKGTGENKIVFKEETQTEEKQAVEKIKSNSIVIDRMIEDFDKFRIDKITPISRSEIYGRLFDKILEYYYQKPSSSQHKYVYALARRDKGEPLLRRYVGWGMEILGEVDHELNGKRRHWILKGDLKKMKKFIEENYKTLEYIKHLNKLN